VSQVSFKNSTGVYAVTLPEAAKFDAAAVKKAVGDFKLERIDIKTKGDVTQDEKGIWLTSPSGVKFLLSNRPKKDEKDTPPDVVAKVAEAIKAGKTTFSVAGQVKEDKKTLTVHLDSAEVVEKKKEDK
jgi:hypothetical protein